MSQKTERIHQLVDKLNQYRDEYYNKNAPSVSDAVYDHLYDELERMEKETGIILSNSPTQTVGYKAKPQGILPPLLPMTASVKADATSWTGRSWNVRSYCKRPSGKTDRSPYPVTFSSPIATHFP